MPKQQRYIEIMDTTLRDGEQTSGVSFSASEKLTIAQLLLTDVKVDRIEIASARVSEGEFEAGRHALVVGDPDFADESVAVTEGVSTPFRGHGLELQRRPLFAFSRLRVPCHEASMG